MKNKEQNEKYGMNDDRNKSDRNINQQPKEQRQASDNNQNDTKGFQTDSERDPEGIC